MTKKSKILFILLSIINLLTTSLITIFALPNKIPVCYNIYEKITFCSSKWLMLISSILPTLFIIFIFFIKNNKVKFIFKALFVLSIFENVLFFSYFLIETNFDIGTLCKIPASVSIFMPISIICLIFSLKIKNLPYKSKFGINFKVTRETEFIWKQTHFYSQNVLFCSSIIMFITSIIFSLFRNILIEFVIFFIIILISLLIIYLHSKSIYNKYIEMKTKKENLDNKKNVDPNETPKTETNTKKNKKKKKPKKSIDGSRLM